MCGSNGGSCSVGSSVAYCPPGQVPIGGGWNSPGGEPAVSATVGYDYPIGSGWEVIMANDEPTSTADFAAYAICAG